MANLNLILEFSRTNCIAICAFLVPAILLTTISTLLLLMFEHSPKQISLVATLASGFTVTILLHVSTWFIIGVITPVTFILSGLGSTCILLNLWAIVSPQTLRRSLLLIKNTLHQQLSPDN